MTAPPGKVYLGDGVFVETEDGMVKLTTEDGLRTTNAIYLEAEVLRALVSYAQRLGFVAPTR